jgi:hypothetical protein
MTRSQSKIDKLRNLLLGSTAGRDQYAKNAAQLQGMANTAKEKGGLYRGKTADQWQAVADTYKQLAHGINPTQK